VRLGALAVVLAVGAVAYVSAAAVAKPAPRQPPPRGLVGEPTFSPAHVLALQMFNPEDGVGVAGLPPPLCQHSCLGEAPERPYLVLTVDGGRSWRATGRVPAYFGPFIRSAETAFQSPSAGYLQSTVTIFTDDGGRTWSPVQAPGVATALSLDGTSLWVVSLACPQGQVPRGLCPSRHRRHRS
jgi:hypothetical protein